MDNQERLQELFDAWKAANRQLLHYQQESYFALVELLASICELD